MILINRLLAPVNQDKQWQSGQDSPEVVVNEGIGLALLHHLTFAGKGTSSPPGSPEEGEAHIIGASPSGDWSTFSEDNIAYYYNGSWREETAVNNMTVTADDGAGNADSWRYVTGTGWVLISAGTNALTDLSDTPGAYSGEVGKIVAVKSAEDGVEFKPTPYDVPVVFGGTPNADEVIARFTLARDIDFPADFSGSQGSVETNPGATFDIDVQDDAVSIGTISISTSGVVSFSTVSGTAKSAVAGSKLEFIGPTPADGSIDGISVMLRATTVDL